MAEILWGLWQEQHIRARHGVSDLDFDAAWHDPERRDLAEKRHNEHGPYAVSVGTARLGKPLTMVWRWQGGAVWPITAYFRRRSREQGRRRRKPRRG